MWNPSESSPFCWPIQELIGLASMTVKLLNTFQFCVEVSFPNGLFRPGKVLLRRRLLCLCCCRTVALLTIGSIFCNRCAIWPSMTTRYASLTPLSIATLRKESRISSSSPAHSILIFIAIAFTNTFFLLGAAWARSRAERPSVSEVSGQLHVQFGCKLTSKLTYRTS